MISYQEINNIVESLLKLEPPPERIILFGSNALNTADSYSDVDLLVIQNSTLPFLERCKKAALLCPLSNIDILVYTPKEANENSFAQNAINQGRLLYEGNLDQIEKIVSDTGVWWTRELWGKERILQNVRLQDFSTAFECLSKIFSAEWTKEQIRNTPKLKIGKVERVNLRESHPILMSFMMRGIMPFLGLFYLGEKVQQIKEKGLLTEKMEKRLRNSDQFKGITPEIKILSYLLDKCKVISEEKIRDKRKKPDFLVRLDGVEAYCEIKSLDLFSIDREYEDIRDYFFYRRDELFNASGQMLTKFIFNPKIVRVFRKKFNKNFQNLFDDVINFVASLYKDKDYAEKFYRESVYIQLMPPEKAKEHELFSKILELKKYREKIARILREKVKGKFEVSKNNFLIFCTDINLIREDLGENIIRLANCYNITGIFFIRSYIKRAEKWKGFNEVEFIPISNG